jgi:Uma2 family endonuclease
MATAASVSVEEYLSCSEKPNREYEDGVVYPKAVPASLHSTIQYVLLMLLQRQGAIALPELTLPISESRFLVPDVTVVRTLQFPYPVDPALLCVEILSPAERVGSLLAKCEKYHGWGVPHCWVIDPEKQTGWDYPKDGEPSRADRTGTLHAGEFSIRLDDLFSAVPRTS